MLYFSSTTQRLKSKQKYISKTSLAGVQHSLWKSAALFTVLHSAGPAAEQTNQDESVGKKREICSKQKQFTRCRCLQTARTLSEHVIYYTVVMNRLIYGFFS